MTIKVIVADYLNKKHADDLISLLSEYANDPMSGNESLSAYIKENLIKELSKFPNAFSLLCYVDGHPAGFSNCFEAFSTFKCKPLINIHDISVKPEYRGKNLSQIMLDKIEDIAHVRGCCKITLEVLEGNKPAQKAYLKYGFKPYQLGDENGTAQFWQKGIPYI
ncbi:hypothetical protein CI610_01029 [invertebrate metagenome]|uniref:N-acetyltransferase domain-containing protein n=1 Tax=invertebrate metagenome TaxID=1711999 RepID=A0A2H9T9S0_9ZZZZ